MLLLLSGCYTSRLIHEDGYLLTGTSISSEDKKVPTDELQAYMPQRPNSKWFSLFKVPLGIYSLSGRDSTKRFNRFLRHLGEAPVIYDRERTIQACNNMQLSVRNTGYLNAEVFLFEKVKKNKMKVLYRIVPHERYHIRNFSFKVEDEALQKALDSLGYQPEITSKFKTARSTPYDINALDAERSKLYGLLCGEEEKRGIDVTVLSFGYKHGLPAEADLVFDARFLPNPFYVDELREKSGLDLPVKEYVFSFQQTRTFMEQLETMLEFLLPLYIEEGKLSLTVAIGCTGGRHRSVAIATALNDHFLAKGISSVNVNRDIDK